ncbi:MAG: hypothetical protein ABT23_04845 [Thiobacillus sp. SCN 63-57]|uniref:hypothetical protein n=1 Tax=Thiobacillus sp. SCN 63-57 TaxID=1660145 RepID=UPI00086C4C6E|nr:hypothetical protein [Thiobacillus sp. SCN 63-57]ODV02807.1 MAG: hypothetical protein ABT23_04845 [Thiobacillus sp. SCN 63-57]
MNTSQPHDTHEIVIAATLWLMHRYQKTGCRKLAHMIEQHLAWMHDRATSPRLVDACRRLSFEWRAVSTGTPMRPTPPILH